MTSADKINKKVAFQSSWKFEIKLKILQKILYVTHSPGAEQAFTKASISREAKKLENWDKAHSGEEEQLHLMLIETGNQKSCLFINYISTGQGHMWQSSSFHF